MKKTILFFILLFPISTVKAARIEVMPATLYFTAIKNDIYTYHLNTYYNMDSGKYIFKIPFHIDSYEYLFLTEDLPNYRDEGRFITLTKNNIKKIEEIIYWGQFYEKYGHNLRYYATQIAIWRLFYPDYDIYLSTKGGERLDYIDSHLEDIKNLLKGDIVKINKQYYPINNSTIINLDLDGFNIAENNNININYENNILNINPTDYTASFSLERRYNENKKPLIYKNGEHQFFVEESNNFDFNKEFVLNVVNMDGNEKEVGNPETGKNIPVFILIMVIIILATIPTILIILLKEHFKKLF